MGAVNPTKRVYDGLNTAYDVFNAQLFAAQLPRCLITMQRQSKAFGFFAGNRFKELAGPEQADEIALNPEHFAARSTKETLSTLVHEMVHLWQHHFGEPGRGPYHNRQWARQMKQLGLQPSDTGSAGGKETGQKMSHTIVEGGRFDVVCTALIEGGFQIPYGDQWAADESKDKAKAGKRATPRRRNNDLSSKPDKTRV